MNCQQRCVSPKDACTPVLRIIKSVLFVVIAVFVLYLPLGDPEVHCAQSDPAKPGKNSRLIMCCICDLYLLSVKMSQKLMAFIEFTISLTMDLLYEAKIKMYTFLETIDGKDLCRSVCCIDENENQNKKDSKPCRCSRNKCSKGK